MATSLDQLSQLLDSLHIEHLVDSKHPRILIPVETSRHRDLQGKRNLVLSLSCPEAGRIARVEVPWFAKAHGTHRASALELLSRITWRRKLVFWRIDPEDGEVRPTVEFPLEEAEIGSDQLLRLLRAIPLLADEEHDTLLPLWEGMANCEAEPGSPEDLGTKAEAATAAAIEQLLQELDSTPCGRVAKPERTGHHGTAPQPKRPRS
jgi:hypothetical protein